MPLMVLVSCMPCLYAIVWYAVECALLMKILLPDWHALIAFVFVIQSSIPLCILCFSCFLRIQSTQPFTAIIQV